MNTDIKVFEKLLTSIELKSQNDIQHTTSKCCICLSSTKKHMISICQYCTSHLVCNDCFQKMSILARIKQIKHPSICITIDHNPNIKCPLCRTKTQLNQIQKMNHIISSDSSENMTHGTQRRGGHGAVSRIEQQLCSRTTELYF